MAILIKGMKMPENCDRCKLVRYFGMAGGIECLAKKEWPATSYANEDFRESGTRPDWCPLVEVPDEQPDRNAQERYEDLCEYFKDCHDKGMGILGDRKEFKAWLERVHWHVVKCDELGRELEKLQSAQPERQWIPIWDGDGQMLEVDEDGCSEYVLLSFGNAQFVCIGRYQVDEDGGAFYDGDEEDPLTKIGLFVNAWMPLPKPYREEMEQDGKKTDC